ncbi:FAM92 protein-domain-containing protein [Powellomyces hirtus]|nr:FAM92 protein-domain-containing protein [Powellomyces hirtus]
MANLRRTLAGYLRNQERLRRKSLKLAVVLKMFSETEAPSLSDVLAGVSELLTERELARENALQRINLLSQEPLKLYAMICSRMKNEVKTREGAIKKEQQKQENFDKMVIKDGTNRTKINQLQLELTSAHQDTKNATHSLMDSMCRFESQKRDDLQKSLGEFIWNEMNYHAQALEILTEAHQLLLAEDLDADLEEIEERIIPAPSSRAGSPIRRRHPGAFADAPPEYDEEEDAERQDGDPSEVPHMQQPQHHQEHHHQRKPITPMTPSTIRRPSLKPQPGYREGSKGRRPSEPGRWTAKDRRASFRDSY